MRMGAFDFTSHPIKSMSFGKYILGRDMEREKCTVLLDKAKQQDLNENKTLDHGFHRCIFLV